MLLQDSSGTAREPYCLQYSPLVDALGVPAEKLPGSTHPMYHVLQGRRAPGSTGLGSTIPGNTHPMYYVLQGRVPLTVGFVGVPVIV